ncbi:MAG: hypothetical protein ACHQ5A_07035, partial [Opitutales bacterium]
MDQSGKSIMRLLLLGAVAAGLSLSARGVLDKNNPAATLYEHPVNARVPAPASFPDLSQDPAGYWQVDFRHLASFSFGRHPVGSDDPAPRGQPRVGLLVPDESDAVELPTEPGRNGTIPGNVQALDGRRVCITGYMLPVTMDHGRVKSCLLLRNQ